MEKRNNLSDLRERRGMSQKEVAEELGITRQAVSQWESGKAFPSMEKQIALSRLYGVSAEELYRMNGTEVQPKNAPESRDTPERKRPQKKIILAAFFIGVYLSVYLWGVLTHSVTLAKICLVFITFIIIVGGILYILITKIVQFRKE